MKEFDKSTYEQGFKVRNTEDGIYYNGSSPSLTIDYIFLNKEELVKSLKFNIINSQKAKDSSDHLPLIYEFEIL